MVTTTPPSHQPPAHQHLHLATAAPVHVELLLHHNSGLWLLLHQAHDGVGGAGSPSHHQPPLCLPPSVLDNVVVWYQLYSIIQYSVSAVSALHHHILEEMTVNQCILSSSSSWHSGGCSHRSCKMQNLQPICNYTSSAYYGSTFLKRTTFNQVKCIMIQVTRKRQFLSNFEYIILMAFQF